MLFPECLRLIFRGLIHEFNLQLSPVTVVLVFSSREMVYFRICKADSHSIILVWVVWDTTCISNLVSYKVTKYYGVTMIIFLRKSDIDLGGMQGSKFVGVSAVIWSSSGNWIFPMYDCSLLEEYQWQYAAS